MKVFAVLFSAMLCGPMIACLSSDDTTVDTVEQSTTVTVDCNMRDVNNMCRECGTGGAWMCCTSGADCKVLCDNWLKDPKTGKTYCQLK